MEKEKISKEECLIAPCGIYCGACDAFLGKGKELAKELHMMPCKPSDTDKENPMMTRAMLELISRRYQNWNIENLKKIKEIGYRKFIDEMEKKVKEGFMTSDVIGKDMVLTEVMKKMKNK